jgi:hypothetical protein
MPFRAYKSFASGDWWRSGGNLPSFGDSGGDGETGFGGNIKSHQLSAKTKTQREIVGQITGTDAMLTVDEIIR